MKYEVEEETTSEGKIFVVNEVKGNVSWRVFKTKNKDKAELVAKLLEILSDKEEGK